MQPAPVDFIRREFGETERPSGGTVGAAFRSENLVVNAIRSGVRSEQFSGIATANYNAWADIENTEYQDQWETFATSESPAETAELKRIIDQEKKDRAYLASQGAGGMAASLLAGVVDVPSLLPGVALAKTGATGARVGVNAVKVGGLAAAEATATEMILQSAQHTRTAEESAFAIGGSVVLGALLGGGATALLSRSDVGQAALNRGRDAMDGKDVGLAPDLDQSLSAAERTRPRSEDFELPNTASETLLKGTPSGIGFSYTFQKARSPAAQKFGLDAISTSFANKGVDRLDAEPAAEVVQQILEDKNRIATGRAIGGQYAEYRKANGISFKTRAGFSQDGELTKAQFSEQIALALRRADQHDNPHVQKAAEMLRAEVIEPLKDKAIRAGLLPEDVVVTTAASYFTRMWDADKIIARQAEFKARLTEHFAGSMRARRGKGEEGFDLDDVELDGYASIVADEVTATMVDRKSMPEGLGIVVGSRGPLKGRTLDVKDLDFEDFLINDAELVLARYSRVMTADITLKDRFGSVDLKDKLEEIRKEYDGLIDGADAKEAASLQAEKTRVIERTEAVRDMMRGTYRIGDKSGMPYRVIQSAMTYNFIRALGGLVVSAIPDVYRSVMVHGASATWGGAVKPLMGNMKGYRIQARQARELAGIAEVELNNRMMAIADITDPLSNRTATEAVLNNMAGVTSTWSGGTIWNDFFKGVATQVTTHRLRSLTNSKADTTFRQRLNLNTRDADSIKSAMTKHGVDVDGVFDPRVDYWPERTRNIYAAVLRADADTVVVTPGIGDKIPAAEHHYWLKPALQFKSFAFAAHSRATMAGLQDNQTRFMMSAANMAALGMFTYWVKAQSSGRDTSDNPGTWIAEGVDRSGVFPLMMELNNWAEGAGIPGVYNILSMGEDEASRYAVRSSSGKVLGPTAGLINDLFSVARTGVSQVNPLASEEAAKITSGDIGAGRRLVPFGRNPGLKEYLDLWLVPELKSGL